MLRGIQPRETSAFITSQDFINTLLGKSGHSGTFPPAGKRE